MRLWSLHPHLLDRAGLVALWREGLLAQAVLAGRTKGYTKHPQLDRFRGNDGGIQRYLDCVANEATCRDYKFDRSKIDRLFAPDSPPGFSYASPLPHALVCPVGQVIYELRHLAAKLEVRDSQANANLMRHHASMLELASDPRSCSSIIRSRLLVHPMFSVDACDVRLASWERF